MSILLQSLKEGTEKVKTKKKKKRQQNIPNNQTGYNTAKMLMVIWYHQLS